MPSVRRNRCHLLGSRVPQVSVFLRPAAESRRLRRTLRGYGSKMLSESPSDGEQHDVDGTASPAPSTAQHAEGMIPTRTRRATKLERGSMRALATGGIIGVATLLGAILGAQDVAGWIVGLVVGLTSVILAAVLWSSRQL
jgi:hypothetical protein